MSVIRFRTTPKGDLPHYSYTFRKTEPLGTAMKNFACSRLGTTIYLEIKKGEEAMNTSYFQKYLGGTVACMKRPTMDTKGCSQIKSNDIYFVDIWFSGVKSAKEVMAAGVSYCGLVKTSHKGFCLVTLEELMKYWPGGSYLVMKSTPKAPSGIPLMAIGYKYNSRNVLGFIAAEGGVSTEPGDPYLSHFPDINSNVSARPVLRPHLLYRYFNACNTIQSKYDAAV